jgi:trimeric autotransporter adhesin
MKQSGWFHLPTGAGRFVGVSGLVGGIMSAMVLAVAAPAAHAATGHPTAQVSSARLDARLIPFDRSLLNVRDALPETVTTAATGWTQAKEIKLQTGCADYECLYGWAEAVSGDTMVVSAPTFNNGIGEVFVYHGSGSKWTLEAELTPADSPAGDFFGGALAINSTTIVVGGPGYNNNAGNAYVYTYSGSGNGFTAVKRAELDDPGQVADDDYGLTVAMSGTTIVIGALGENSSEGAVYGYDKSGNTWHLADTLSDPGGVPGDGFGWSAAFVSSTLVVGAPGTDGTGSETPANSNEPFTGAAYVFREVDGGFVQSAELTASNGQGCTSDCSDSDVVDGDYFGYSVAVKSGTVAVGSAFASYPVPAPNGSGNGTVYTFTETSGHWTQTHELYDPAEETSGPPYNGDWFGYDVVFSGSAIVVTAPGDPQGFESNDSNGAAFVFAADGKSWATYPVELNAKDGYPGEYFGYAVATIGTTYVLVGAPYWAKGSAPYGSGSLYIFKG